ncbi:hypothetical protein J6590_020113 [Homalodisca vitripennis]|nr:hypothetical protein J6590_020113 [Homalodisca vitripennis]
MQWKVINEVTGSAINKSVQKVELDNGEIVTESLAVAEVRVINTVESLAQVTKRYLSKGPALKGLQNFKNQTIYGIKRGFTPPKTKLKFGQNVFLFQKSNNLFINYNFNQFGYNRYN